MAMFREARLTKPASTLSESDKNRIRMLHEIGVPASKIAKAIKRRCEHVRNYVLLLDERAVKASQPQGLVAGPRTFVNATMTEPLPPDNWRPPRG